MKSRFEGHGAPIVSSINVNAALAALQASQEVRLLRLPDVLARVPVSRSSWFAGIQSGRYPKGLHLGPRTTVWRSDDIAKLICSLEVQS